MTPTSLELNDDRREDVRRSSDGGSFTKSLGIVIVVVSIVGTIFTVGYNWRSIANIEAAQNDYVRKDVQGQQLRNVDDRLSDISRQLEELRNELRASRRKEP